MEKIKVALIITSLQIGGAERMFLNLVQSLNLQKFHIKVFVLKKSYSTSFDQELINSKIEYVYLNKRFNYLFDIFTLNKLTRYLEEFGPNIIHSHLKVTNYLIKYKLRNPEVKWIHTHHTTVKREIKYLRKHIMKYLYQKKLLYPVCVSQAVKNSLLKTFKIKNLQTQIIYNGINLEKFYYERKKINNDGLQITNVGRFDKVKNQQYLVREFIKFFKTSQMSRLNLVGDGSEREQIMQIVKKHGLQDVISFIAHSDEVDLILRRSDIFVVSSLYEGNSLSIIEAMASGCVIVASDVGGNSELVENGVNGYLYKLAPNKLLDRLIHLNNRRELIFKMSKVNNSRSTNFTVNKMKTSYEELYINQYEN